MATPMLETVVGPCMEVVMLLQTAPATQTHRSDGVSAEGEDVGACARVEEPDLEGPRADGPALAHELVHPWFGDDALARLVDVEAVVVAGRLAVEQDGEPHGAAAARRRQDQVEVAGLEAVGDRSGGSAEDRGLFVDRPPALERPLVERQPFGACVDAALAARVADV